MQRFRRLESEISLGTLDDFTDPQTAAVLDRLTRYQARAQRAYYTALREPTSLPSIPWRFSCAPCRPTAPSAG